MRAGIAVPLLDGARAVILHRPHPTVAALSRQLRAIGLDIEAHWPDLPAGAITADYIFFDADLGHDGQFPWRAGDSPMPMIALIGSEAPGRIEWALSQGATGQIIKPAGGAGVFSALLIARQAFDARKAQEAAIAELRNRLSKRQTIVRAVALIARGDCDETAAFNRLRHMAMIWRVTIEEAAQRVVSHGGRSLPGRDPCPICGGNGLARPA
jgi:two-component system, response regulator / RNA-binding antiterminator